MNCLCRLVRNGLAWGIVAALACSLSPAVAKAQSVRGSGIYHVSSGAPDGGNFFQEVSVDAYFDRFGVLQGRMTWVGDLFQPLPAGGGPPALPGGPADPFIVEVLDIHFGGRSALVMGITVSSPQGLGNGTPVFFLFTDNSGTGQPDEINGVPIDAGHISVTD